MFSLMGNCCSCIRRKRQPKRPVTLAILGLDSAGKTTTTKAFLGDTLETAPTVGFNKEEFDFDHYSIVLYDLGGGTKIRDIWKDYLDEIYGIIYVIDTSARERMDEVKNNLWNLISHEKVQSKPVLVLANKEDIEDHMDEVEIMQTLQLEDLVNVNKCPCKMVMCSAIKGTGKKMDANLKIGMTWLCSILDQSYDKLRIRVARDMEVVEERRQKEKEERRERVRRQKEERQRKEEEENKRLGIKKEDEEDDDDDIVDGVNPFKRLDSEEIQKKEEKFRLAKEKEKERKKRLKEMEDQENTNPAYLSDNTVLTSNNNGYTSHNIAFTSNNTLTSSRKEDIEDDGLHVPRSSRSLGSFGLFNGSLSHRKTTLGSDDDPDSDANIPRSGRQLLPPLQSPIGTKFMEGNPSSNKEKKKAKKKKPKGGILDESSEQSKDNHVYGLDNYGHSTMSVSKIDVVSRVDDESDASDKNVTGKDKYFKDSTPVVVDSGRKQKGKNELTKSNYEDGFDTLRLSQHLDDNDDEGLGSGRSFSPAAMNSHISNDYSTGRSQTPVKKLKKKNKHLRKNKLAPSDDEHELSDITQSPKKEPLPWDKPLRPQSQLEISDAIEDDHITGSADRWRLAEDLTVTDGNQPLRRSRPNFDSDDLIL